MPQTLHFSDTPDTPRSKTGGPKKEKPKSLFAPRPMSNEERSAWAVLDAFGVKGNAASSLLALEDGAAGLLQGDIVKFHSFYERSFDKKAAAIQLPLLKQHHRGFIEKRLSDAREHASKLQPLLDVGGHIIAGAQRGRLVHASSPPLCLYGRGDLDVLAAAHRGPTIAIVGTRMPSQRGEKRAEALAYALAKAGVVIVSGGALGIDLAAHRGALAAGGRTLAILGEAVPAPGAKKGARPCGRPRRLEDLFAKNKPEQSLSMTSCGPWTPTSRRLFVSRNRLVAAMADAVVLVEGKEKSGSLYTAKAAGILKRPVFAVPGDPDDELAFAGNQLLAAGNARMLLGVDPLLNEFAPYALRAQPPSQLSTRSEKESSSTEGVPCAPPSRDEEQILNGIRDLGGRALLDDLADHLRLAVSDLLEHALMLEIEGHLFRNGAYLCVR
ncbi:MAG: hypothetical protein GY822_21290 [Deltaproteobacteria bacterium]|nr:hypothetical protein [Deltaproteobacteria bacterium]